MQRAPYRILFEVYRGATQEIFERDFPNLSGQATLLHRLTQPGHGLELNFRVVAQLENPRHFGASRRGNRNQNDSDSVARNKRADRAASSKYPHSGEMRKYEAKIKIEQLIRKYQLGVLAIGNGTACRETEQFVSELIGDL